MTRIATIFASAIAFGAVLTAAAPSARADGPIELGGFGGFHYFAGSNELGAFEDDPLVRDIEPGVAFGVRLAWWPNPRAGVEGELSLVPTQLEAPDGTPEEAPEDDLFVVGWRAQAIVHLVCGGRIRPFAVAGLGALSAASSDSNNRVDDTDLAFHAGAGVRIGIKDDWGIRIDTRAILPPSSDSESLTFDFEMTVGLYGFFNEPKPAPPAEAK
jgi:opacity protein-like surface antigen